MRVLIFMSYDAYPKGSAATKHAQMLARGLVAAGAEVRFLARPLPGQPGSGQGWLTDSYGLQYQLASYRAAGVLGKLVMFARLPGDYRRALGRILDEMPYDAVVMFGHTWMMLRGVLRNCRRRGIPCVQYFTEWFTTKMCSPLNPFFWDIVLDRRRGMRKLDGVIAISKVLQDCAERAGTPSILVPALAVVVSEQPSGKCRLKEVSHYAI